MTILNYIPFHPVVPSSVPSSIYIVVKSSSVLWLHWSPPPPPDIHINGIISYYNIISTETQTGKNWTFVAVGRLLRVGSLLPDSMYSFTVAAWTFGNGPYSAPVNATTLEDGRALVMFHIVLFFPKNLFR